MTNRSRGVLKTRCSAMVSSTTPRFGPRCPPVCERILMSSSRTSCASCGRSCSRSALISAGERIPSSKRAGAEDSEEFDFIICAFGFIDGFGCCCRFLHWFEIFHYGFASAVAGNDFDLLLGVGKSFLANLHQIHSFFVAHNQLFQGQFAGFHLLNDRFEPIHRTLKVELGLTLFRFAAHLANQELSTAPPLRRDFKELAGHRSRSDFRSP